MPTFYSEYTEIILNDFLSDLSEININVFSSIAEELFLNYFTSTNAEITTSFNIPGGILTWTNASNLYSSANACRLHQTIEAGIPMGNTISRINKLPSFIFEKLYGQDVFTQYYKNPSVILIDNEFKIANISNNINLFVEGEGKIDQRSVNLYTHVSPIKIAIGKISDKKISAYAYFNDGNIYAFEIENEFLFSSSSQSSSSSKSVSTSSSLSSSSTQRLNSSSTSESSKTSLSSGSSSSLSSNSTISSGGFSSISSSSISSSSVSSPSTISTMSSGSSSSASP